MRREILKTIDHEGGFVDDPADLGGETKYGISRGSYPTLDIAALTLEDAVKLYERDYWNPLNIDRVVSIRVRWKVYDIGVNMGVWMAKTMLQRALLVPVDGNIGPVTLAAANDREEYPLLVDLMKEQMGRYVDITVTRPMNLRFLRGWFNRATDLGEGLVE